MSILKRLLIAMAAAAGLQAQAGQYTDLWWNPQESGWGLNLVQQLDSAFLTMFVYGADGKPTWYSASDLRIVVIASNGLPIFGGSLYRTTGPFHAGPFDPNQVTRTFVGMVSLEALSTDRLRVQYQADGATVTKEVVRSTFALPIAAANYHGSMRLRQATSPGGQPYGALLFSMQVLLTVDDQGRVFMRADDELGRRCEYNGPYAQSGRLGKASGTFACTPGANGVQGHSGTFDLTDLEVTTHGITGFLRTASAGRYESGRFAAAAF
jgi:hypothetical protein